MSTITKERLEPVIERLEHYATNVKWTNVQAEKDMLIAVDAMRRLLASLEAEAVAFRSKLKPPSAIGSESWDYTDHRQPDAFELENCVIERLFTDPPVPVSVPDELTREEYKRRFMEDDDFDDTFRGGWSACRAAMLQGAENAESPTTMQTAPSMDSSQKIAESPSGNSPVIQDGWVMVPVEPTEDMIVNGFESEPDKFFSDAEVWEAYDAMSGCQQAAHRAKLCWAAMIAAAPQQEVKP
ncbi:hypothetical protein ABIN12_004139 [Enterobacter cloacae]